MSLQAIPFIYLHPLRFRLFLYFAIVSIQLSVSSFLFTRKTIFSLRERTYTQKCIFIKITVYFYYAYPQFIFTFTPFSFRSISQTVVSPFSYPFSLKIPRVKHKQRAHGNASSLKIKKLTDSVLCLEFQGKNRVRTSTRCLR